MDKSRLLNIFKNLDSEESEAPTGPMLNLHLNSRVLLVDGMNLFLRNFSAINKVNFVGNHVGGLTGFLRSLGSLIKEHSPTKIVIVFDGEKGSQARKYLYRPYKANRDSNKVVNTKIFSSAVEERGSKNDQITRLVYYLRCLPVTIMMYENLEADDVIAYLAKYIPETYPDSYTYIVSSDQDYTQLVNERVFLHSPTKKILYTTERVLSEYGTHPLNINVYKTLVGDTSDNMPGVSGVGKGNIGKLFEGLREPEMKGLEYIYQVCQEKPRKSALYDRILFVKNSVEVMYQVVDLHSPNIHEDDIEDIEKIYQQKAPALNKSAFLSLYSEDLLGDAIPYTMNWLENFTPLGRYKPR